VAERERSGRGRQRLRVPVGIEKLLYLAARDPELERRLIEKRAALAAELGVGLRLSERETLEQVPEAGLRAMIRALVPENPRRRRMMRVVAAAAASLAAGTATIGCDAWDGQGKGCTMDADVDGSFDAAADTDGASDSDTVDTDTDSFVGGGVLPDADVDGEFD
jgi:hypothetical protein